MGLFAAAYLLKAVFWAPLDYRFYNYFHAKRPIPPWTKVVVVAIDEATRSKVFTKPIFPLSRHIDDHARVTKELDAAGVRAIVFDLRLTEDDFDAPVDPLAEVFRSTRKVYLVMSLVESGGIGASGESASVLQHIKPHPDLVNASEGAYVADVRIDPDGVLRRFPYDPRLHRLKLKALPARLADTDLERDVPIEFPSEDEPIPVVSYYDVWRGEEELRPELDGKIAFVGSVLDESVDYVSVPRLQRLDGNRKGFVLPGVAALAATTETLLRGEPIRDASRRLTLLWNLLWCVAAVRIMPRRKPVRAALLFGAVMVVAVVVTGLFHVYGGLVFSIGLLVGCLLFVGGYTLVAAHVEAEKLIAVEEAEIERVHRELETARETQRRFLPKAIPKVEGYDLSGINISSREVSGDYFDIIDEGEGAPLIVAIADVSGKGLPAALVMSNVQAALHSHVLQGRFDLALTMRHLNRLVYENTSDEMFVTMLVGELDKKTGLFRYARAGHDIPTVVTRDASVRTLDKGGLVLGLLADAECEIGEDALQTGDVLCLYTDGLTEARNPQGEEFQTGRLTNVLKDARGGRAEEIVERVVDSLRRFSRMERQADDVTIVVLKREGLPVL